MEVRLKDNRDRKVKITTALPKGSLDVLLTSKCELVAKTGATVVVKVTPEFPGKVFEKTLCTEFQTMNLKLGECEFVV